MSYISIHTLEDRARDVDPDLRYMALEDFQKSLETQQYANHFLFVPLLFQLLEDAASEVQNQAVKTFAPLIRHSNDEEARQIIEKLYQKVEDTANASSFSSSVPTLALRGIFNESQGHLNKDLSRSIFSMLLPRIFSSGSVMTIDKIEILIDSIKSAGSVLTMTDLSTIVMSLISSVFREKGMVSKRSIIAIDVCLSQISHASKGNIDQQVEFFDRVISSVVSSALKGSSSGSSRQCSDVFYTLLQVVLAQASHNAISQNSARTIFENIQKGLLLDKLEERVESEDLDIDELIQTNIIRENALITLAGLVACFGEDLFHHTYASRIFEIVNKFIKYDPLSFNDSENESDIDDESEVDFSDDEDIEQFESTGENDVLAAKLRLSASVVVKKMLQSHPQVLSMLLDETTTNSLIENISDQSEVVSNESVSTIVVLVRLAAGSICKPRSRASSDVSMATEFADHTPYAVVTKKHIGLIKDKLFGELLSAKNIARFPGTKALAESLIQGFADEDPQNFLEQFTQAILILGLSLRTFPDIVQTYRVILETYTYETLPEGLVDYITNDLSNALSSSSTYHGVVSEILSVCGILYKLVAHVPKYAEIFNQNFFVAIAESLKKKEYASDLKQRFLESLADLMIHVELTSENASNSVVVFQESLNSEVATNFAIEIMVKVCQQKPHLFNSRELCQACLEKLLSVLKSSDSSLHVSSLSLLNTIFEKTQFKSSVDELKTLRISLIDLMKGSVDFNLIAKTLTLLGYITRIVPANEDLVRALFTSIINAKLADVDDFDTYPLKFLAAQISSHNNIGLEGLFTIGKRFLVSRNFISAKVMAFLCASGQMGDAVCLIEQDLLSKIHMPSGERNNDHLIFDIHFLGCLSLQHDFKTFSFQEFFEILKTESNEQICFAASRAMGLCTVNNIDTYLPVLLDCYSQASSVNDPKRSFFLIALKQLLKEYSWGDKVNALRRIWDSLLQIISSKQGSLTHKEVSELKSAGDILSDITTLDHEIDYQHKLSGIIDHARQSAQEDFLIYTVVVVMKKLAGNAKGHLKTENVGKIMQYLAISNLELKSAIVSTLLTGIYTNSKVFATILDSVILPAIVNELDAKDEFKKVIPMGPYKYVVDEGLEVRRLSYELISAIINLNRNKVQGESYQVDEAKIFRVLLEKGVKDKESEIISLTISILMQLIQKDENMVFREGKQDELIAALQKLASRKLSNKVSAQEAENYEEILRSVLKLSKITNKAFTNHKASYIEWLDFYSLLKRDHHLLFSALDV